MHSYEFVKYGAHGRDAAHLHKALSSNAASSFKQHLFASMKHSKCWAFFDFRQAEDGVWAVRCLLVSPTLWARMAGEAAITVKRGAPVECLTRHRHERRIEVSAAA